MHQTIRSETFDSQRTATLRATDASAVPSGGKETEKTREAWLNAMGERLARAKSFDPEMALPMLPSERPLQPARNPPSASLYDYFGFLYIFKPLITPFSRRLRAVTGHPEPQPAAARGRTLTGKRIKPQAADSNVPVEIALFLHTYFASLLRQGLLTPALATGMNNAITMLQDIVVNLERIKNTPLPFAYQAHLRLSLW